MALGCSEVRVGCPPEKLLPGQYYDRETGYHYNYYRDYDPRIGRYLQSDPIGLEGGMNTYGYVYQNPLKYSDPNGLDAISVGGSVRIPAWISKIFGAQVPLQGGSFGLAVSFPGFTGGTWDAGLYWGLNAGGVDYGIGRASINIGYNSGSVCNLAGQGAQAGGHWTPVGASVNSSNGQVTGGSISIGPGYNIGSSGTLTGTLSVVGGYNPMP